MFKKFLKVYQKRNSKKLKNVINLWRKRWKKLKIKILIY